MADKEKFSVKPRIYDGVLCLDIIGYLDAHTAPMLEGAIEKAINEGNKYILVNFENLDYISSAGLGVFMGFIEEIRNLGGDIKMSDMKEKVYSVFDLLGFPILFDIESSQRDAIEKFKKGIVNKS